VIFATTSDFHSIVDGLVVVSLFAILGIGLKLLTSQRRLHEAVFGYKEGERVEPGILQVIKGNGKGNLLKVSEQALAQGEANGEALRQHVIEDNRRWDAIDEHLQNLEADRSGPSVDVDVAVSPAPVIPIKRVAKKAPARKRAAPRKTTT
jgi:hypothetical protein